MKLVIDNENKKISRNGKRTIERNVEKDDKMKTLLNNFKSEKKNKNKNIDKIKQIEMELVKIKNANNPKKLEPELKELNKIQVFDKSLHEIENEI